MSSNSNQEESNGKKPSLTRRGVLLAVHRLPRLPRSARQVLRRRLKDERGERRALRASVIPWRPPARQVRAHDVADPAKWCERAQHNPAGFARDGRHGSRETFRVNLDRRFFVKPHHVDRRALIRFTALIVSLKHQSAHAALVLDGHRVD